MRLKITALTLALLLLTGCAAYNDVETLLRAPQLSGESAALQKALNSYLGGSATLKYPASGDFLSPFAFGDWGRRRNQRGCRAVYGRHHQFQCFLAVLEPSGEDSWACEPDHRRPSSEVETSRRLTCGMPPASRFWPGMAVRRETGTWWCMSTTAPT